MVRDNKEIQLVQNVRVTPLTIETTLSEEFNTFGFRGLAVLIPGIWTAADIGFYGIYGPDAVPLFDELGNPVSISGIAIATKRLYIAPANVWAIGGFTHGKIASINIDGTGALVNQAAARQIKIYRMY